MKPYTVTGFFQKNYITLLLGSQTLPNPMKTHPKSALKAAEAAKVRATLIVRMDSCIAENSLPRSQLAAGGEAVENCCGISQTFRVLALNPTP